MAAISFKKINRAAIAERHVHKKITIITIILYSVATALFMFTSDAWVYTGKKGDQYGHFSNFSPSGWGIFFSVLGVLIGFIAAISCFRDMNNQQICDVTMALPIKSEERFLSKLMAIFYIQIIPQLTATVVGCGIPILIGIIRSTKVDPDVPISYIMTILAFLAGSMFMIAVAVLCACCTGAFAESVYFSVIAMVIINALPVFMAFRFFDQCSGIGWVEDHADIFSYWGFMFLGNSDYEAWGMVLSCAVGIAISAAVMFVMLFVYRKRDARSVGDPVSNRVFFEIFMLLGVFTIYTAFVMTSAAFWGVLIAAVIYTIISIIVSRAKINFYSFLKWGAKFLAATAVYLVVFTIAVKTGGFGYIYTRPTDEELEGASFEITYDDWYPLENRSSATHLYADNLTQEQAVQIMDIVKEHIVKGRQTINPVDVIFHNTFWPASFSDVDLEVNGRALDIEPEGKFIGYKYVSRSFPVKQYDENQDIEYGLKYYLYFEQNTTIPLSESRAMANDLKSLSFVHTEKDKPYSSTYYEY